MKLTWLSATLCVSTSLVNALPTARPVEEAKFEVREVVSEFFDKRSFPTEMEDFKTLMQKRDTTSTVETLINLLNDSDILYDVLDSVAYNPRRIQYIANITSKLLGNVDIKSFTDSSSNYVSGLNFSRIYNAVMDSGVVSSLLDGILLDESFQPVLVNLTSRILEGNKNLVNYIVKDLFKSSKRDTIQKRANGGSLEMFLGNIITTVLDSSLVADTAEAILVSLNKTQFLTTTAKTLIANEGYQNMTAQLFIDVLNTGNIKIDSKAINVTEIAEKALSKPAVIVNLVSNLLSGNAKFPALGKYSDAISDIVKKVESKGVFADLNDYVFSQTHSVTKPIIPTGQIVVPRTTSAKTTKTTKTSVTKSTKTSSTKKTKKTTTSEDLDNLSGYGSGNWGTDSADDVLSGYGSGVWKTQDDEDVESTTTTRRARATTTRRSRATATNDDDLSESESAAQVSSILAQLRSDSAIDNTDVTSSFDDGDSASSTNAGGILAVLGALGDTSTSKKAKRADATATATAGSSGASLKSTSVVTCALISAQALLIGAILIL